MILSAKRRNVLRNHFLALTAAGFIAGCAGSSDYAPPPGATGEKIFLDACVKCHKSITDFKFPDNGGSVEFIAKKVTEGSFMMTSFPNIKGEAMDLLAKYILAHNKTEKP